MAHGEFGKWLESIGISWRQANRLMQAVDQFGNSSMSTNLPFSKIVEMLSLPSNIDREQFIEQKHEIPSTGEAKTVDEMTVRELREVKKALKEAQERAVIPCKTFLPSNSRKIREIASTGVIAACFADRPLRDYIFDLRQLLRSRGAEFAFGY